jgi:LacI family transcriptional regulator
MVLQRSITLEDVAREAGVSRAAVSKVIRKAYGVSPDMQKRVHAAIEKTKYRPSVPARAMMGSSYTLGFELAVLENPALARMVQSAADALAGTDYQLIAAPSGDSTGAGAIQALLDLRVAGIIAIAPLAPKQWLEEISAAVPLVMLARHDHAAAFDTVSGDDEQGTRLLMEHLFELGHNRIAHLTRFEDFTSSAASTPHSVRLKTYLDCMASKGLKGQIVRALPSEMDASRAMNELLDSSNPPTAVFASTDDQALGALRVVMERGLQPSDISIAGFDDIRVASHPGISLTTVAQAVQAQGALAVSLLLERIQGRTETRHVSTPTSLKVRRSTAPPRPAE